jgi:hypothetical protein
LVELQEKNEMRMNTPVAYRTHLRIIWEYLTGLIFITAKLKVFCFQLVIGCENRVISYYLNGEVNMKAFEGKDLWEGES